MLTILMLMLGLFLPFDPLMAQGCANPEAGFTATVDPNDNCQYTFMPQYTGTGIVLTHAWTFRNGTSLSFSSSDQPVPIHQFSNGTVGTVQHTITVLLNGQTVTYTCTQTLTLSCTTGRLMEVIAQSSANRVLPMK